MSGHINKLLSRNLSQFEIKQRPWLEIANQCFLDFSSNDYLALRFDENIQRAYKTGIELYGIGSGGSPLVCGYDLLKHQFEESFSNFINVEKSLLFTSGYSANLSLFSTLYLKQEVAFFLDKSCHASIYDALVLREKNNTQIYRYPHQDLNQLENLLIKSSALKKVIVSEGVFSMTGQQANVARLSQIKNTYNATLIIDDAHCIGVKGKFGEGSSSYVKAGGVDVLICPLGKAFAMQGAIIGASQEIINNLIQNARPYIYSTALGSAVVYALQEVLNKIKKSAVLREKLESNISYFKQQIQNIDYNFLESDSAIQYLVTSDAKLALDLFKFLKKNNIYCYPMREPTVTKNNTGLRIVLSAAHARADFNKLFKVLKIASKKR